MSGGFFNYLCHKDTLSQIASQEDELEKIKGYFLKYGCEDIASDIQRLIEYIKSARVRIETLQEMLRGVFWAAEWYESGDIGEKALKSEIEAYRTNNKEISNLIRCKDCKMWTKQKDSIQGRCACFGTYPTGSFYCANAEWREDE